MQQRLLCLLAMTILSLSACAGDDSSGDGDASGGSETGGTGGEGSGQGTDGTDGGQTDGVCETAGAPVQPAVSGVVYTDDDETDATLYTGAFNLTGDTPESGIPVRLYDGDTTLEESTCLDGSYAFGSLAEGSYLTSFQWPDGTLCQTRNCPRRVGGAVESGSLTMVTIGDSVPVVGSNALFPDHLARHFEPMTSVVSTNLAVGGSVSDDWLPGTSNFESRLRPQIIGADVIIISLGGNDFLDYVGSGMSDPNAAIEGLPDFVRETMGKLLDIVHEVRAVNPAVDVVYLLYPNYSQSDLWASQFGFAISMIQPLVAQSLNQILDELPVEEDIIVVDFYGYFERNAQLDLDDYLFDQLHFNDAGHVLYAEQIFRTLGGNEIQGTAGGNANNYGLAP